LEKRLSKHKRQKAKKALLGSKATSNNGCNNGKKIFLSKRLEMQITKTYICAPF